MKIVKREEVYEKVDIVFRGIEYKSNILLILVTFRCLRVKNSCSVCLEYKERTNNLLETDPNRMMSRDA